MMNHLDMLMHRQVIVCTKLVLYTYRQSIKYIQCIKLLIHNIEDEGVPATDTDHTEECPPPKATVIIILISMYSGLEFSLK